MSLSAFYPLVWPFVSGILTPLLHTEFMQGDIIQINTPGGGGYGAE